MHSRPPATQPGPMDPLPVSPSAGNAARLPMRATAIHCERRLHGYVMGGSRPARARRLTPGTRGAIAGLSIPKTGYVIQRQTLTRCSRSCTLAHRLKARAACTPRQQLTPRIRSRPKADTRLGQAQHAFHPRHFFCMRMRRTCNRVALLKTSPGLTLSRHLRVPS